MNFYSVILIVVLVALAWFDLRERRLPNRLVLAVAVLGVAFRMVECIHTSCLLPLGTALLGVLASAGPAAVAAALYYALRHKQGFGAGDLKLLAALGLFFGPLGFWILPLASVLATVMDALPRMLFKKETVRKHTFAFGPYIALASCVLLILLALSNSW